MQQGLLQALGLGALHGTTTFFPLSREGHLALCEMLFDLEGVTPVEALALMLGALAATMIVARHAVGNLGRALLRALRRPTSLLSTHDGRDLITVCLAQIPTMIFWLALGDSRQNLGRQPGVIAIGLCITAVALMSTVWVARGERLQPTWVQALLLGVGQGIAWLPGMSASGCTIAIALWLGLTKRRSFELAMLVSLPVLVIGSAQSLTKAHLDTSFYTGVAAAMASLGAGVIAGKLLREVVVRGQIAWFAMWVAPLAIATLAFSRAWPAH